MPNYEWPHAHLPHALCEHLKLATDAEERVTTRIPRERTYPLLVVSQAGLGRLGTDYTIQADEIRVQIDSWATTLNAAEKLAGQVFRLLDKRFASALRDVTLMTEDDEEVGTFYVTKIERIGRTGGGESYFDEFAKVYRSTAFYFVKVNL